MRAFAVVTATVLFVIAIGVGMLAASTRNTATVEGRLGGLVGGPAQLFLPTAGTVSAVQDSKVVTTVKVSKNGEFSFSLASGTYRLEGTHSPPLGDARCRPTVVRLRAHTSVSIRILCILEGPR